MMVRARGRGVRSAVLAAAALATVGSATGSAVASTPGYLYWSAPEFGGAPVRGDEPGLGQAMPDANSREMGASLLWSLRAGLNVAALQCQFSPALATVKNYNDLLGQHGGELTSAYTALNTYFKRTHPKDWQTVLDQYTTRTYNGFSTLHAQLGFCDTAASIGREAIAQRKGDLHRTAELRMREFRNSLVPAEDATLVPRLPTLAAAVLPPLNAECWDKKQRLKKQCWTLVAPYAGNRVAVASLGTK